ncbi:sugar ABC transporter permease [Kribbella hippodromi]|uniref:Sugar ABC transporter permease n=1 Tax=Kribbella hippodromi TaxID=434347 RepID=A0ABN2DEC0_9ACTN
MSRVMASPAGLAPRARVRSGGSPAEQGRRKIYWPFITPALLFYVGFFVVPALYGVWVSFVKWRGMGDPQVFVGFGNYRRMWRDESFRMAFTNTITILIVCGVGVFACSFLISSILRELKLGPVLRTIMFVPHLLSPIAVGIGLGLLLSPDGLLNATLRLAGLGSAAQLWLTPDWIFKMILIATIWGSTGYYVMLMASAIGRIPGYYYEQAALDGAGRFRAFLHVTLPLTWDLVSVTAVLWMISAIRIFEFVYGLVGTGANPPPQARTMTIEVFLTTTGGAPAQYDMGLGSAMAVVMVLMTLVLVVAVRRFMRREALEF